VLKVDFSKSGIKDITQYQSKIDEIHQKLVNKSGEGNAYLGWYDWPLNYDKQEVENIKALYHELKGTYDCILVCGIGGSYLGCRAAAEMLRGLYPEGIELIYIGNTFSPNYLKQILNYIDHKEPILNVISKSGTTTETALSYGIFSAYLKKRYGAVYKKRIIVTTDKEKGNLKQSALKYDYPCFVIPDDIGGRYSVSTAVGLVPLALAGIDIEAILKGSLAAKEKYNASNLEINDAYRYGLSRYLLQQKGYDVEMLVTYELQLVSFAEWFKQLFGESEGKDGKGILPTSVCFSTDLHSMGQFIQDGKKLLFETLLYIKECGDDIHFMGEEASIAQMDYLADKDLSWMNEMMAKGTIAAHHEQGNVPIISLELKDNSAFSFGYLIYFFYLACATSCYLNEINPFNQPGVEIYKKKMFELLGKE